MSSKYLNFESNIFELFGNNNFLFLGRFEMENQPKKSNIRSTKAQIQYLCQYMLEHQHFAAGDYRSPLGATQLNDEWRVLKEALDELGPTRSVEQWKICWRDQKRKSRAEAGAHNKALNATGNIVPMPELSDTSVLVLGAIGQEMAVGFGPEESPIGSSQGPFVMEPTSSTSQSNANFALPKQPLRTAQSQRQALRRRQHLSEKFLNVQIELNNLIKELIKEVHHSNVLREEHLNTLRGGKE